MHSGASEYVKSTQRFLYSCKCGKRPWISRPHILSLGMHYMISLTSCTPDFFLFKSEEASEWRLTQTSIYFEANSDADAQNLRTVIKRTMFRSAQWSVSLFHLFSPCLLSSSFIPLLNPIRPGTRAAELCLHRLQLDTHTHSLHTIICIHVFHTHTHALWTLHTLPPINFLPSFVWIKTLKSAYKRWPWDTED